MTFAIDSSFKFAQNTGFDMRNAKIRRANLEESRYARAHGVNPADRDTLAGYSDLVVEDPDSGKRVLVQTRHDDARCTHEWDGLDPFDLKSDRGSIFMTIVGALPDVVAPASQIVVGATEVVGGLCRKISGQIDADKAPSEAKAEIVEGLSNVAQGVMGLYMRATPEGYALELAARAVIVFSHIRNHQKNKALPPQGIELPKRIESGHILGYIRTTPADMPA